MSPASNYHGRLRFEGGVEIRELKRGKGTVITGCSIQTSQGVKVADVAWASDERIEKFGFEIPHQRAPELCVEVVFPSKHQGEIVEKIERYLAKGAHEVWIISEDGRTRYDTYEGEIEKSAEAGSLAIRRDRPRPYQ